MNRKLWGGLGAAALVLAVVAIVGAQNAPAERWLHIRVDDTSDKGELVRVNLPLSVAEKVLPAVKAHNLENGRIKLRDLHIRDVDVRAVLEAVRNSADGEFVTVESKTQKVRVAKKDGYLLINVREEKGDRTETVDVKLPMSIVDALLSGSPDELDLLAAIRVLQTHGDTELVTVKERSQTVRIWVDSKNTSE